MGQEPISINAAKARAPENRATASKDSGVMSVFASGLQADKGRYPLWTRMVRALRRARILGVKEKIGQMTASPSLLAHTAAEGEGDLLFCLSHRYYLAKGLSTEARISAAHCHYRHEDQTYRPAYYEQVYKNGGLVLWSFDSPNHRYDIVLQPGRDVAYEGGLSVALRVDGGCLCVLSFSLVPSRVLGSAPGLPETIHMVSRRHLTKDRSYQADYNRAFNRSTPAHMVFAALEGLILAQGRSQLLGIAPERHPSDRADLNPWFRAGYSEFWTSLGGRSLGDAGYLIELPMRLSPLDDLDAAKRKRALQRRAHLDAVRQSARAQVSLLLAPAETA